MSVADPAAPIVTKHSLSLTGHVLAYTAETGQIAIRDAATGEVHGSMFYTAYRVGTPGGKPRPVTFVWNGGPGADSSTLHFRMVGPKIWREGALRDNPLTWLRDTDLVFVDPVGTGFSRPAKRDYGQEFYGTLGDVASVSEFVRAWLIQHDAGQRPVFLAGESYGAGRAANVGYRLEANGVPVAGLILISGGTGLNKDFVAPSLRAALHIEELNAVAAFHSKAVLAPQAEIDRFARDVYAPALADPQSLSADRRQAVMAQVARYTGLPESAIDAKSLRVTARAFRTGLLTDEGKTLNVFDMRLTQDPAEPDGKVLTGYLRHDLGYASDLPYVGLEPLTAGYAPGGDYPQDVGEVWDYATAKMTPEEVDAAVKEAMRTGEGPPHLGPPLPAVPDALKLNPRLRVFVAAGRDDSLNSCAANAETGRALPEDLRQAVSFHCYEGGHMMYLDAVTLPQLTADVGAFIRGKNRP